MSSYTKSPLSIEEQVNKLEQRGMLFKNDDKKSAENFLSHNNYYRFSGYAFTFQDRKSPKLFKKDVDFETVLNLYEFDSELRSLLMKAISKIEIALRTQIVNNYSMMHLSHWHIDPSLFKDRNRHNEFLKNLQDNIKCSGEDFIRHYNKEYETPSVPPNWMCLEIISFGQLSLLYKNLDDSKGPKINIAKHFGLNTTHLLGKWIHGIHIIRNICAHHGRLWNRSIPVEMLIQNEISKDLQNSFIKIMPSSPNRIYASICSIQYLLDIIESNNTFRNELKELMNKLPANQKGNMGFVKNWDKDQFWN